MDIKIAIADDHPMIIGGLKNIISNHSHLVLTGTYFSGKELLDGFREQQPDVLLLDIQMPDKTGDELAGILLRHYPLLKILVLTNFNSAFYVNNMMQHGVHGYLLKTAHEATLIDAIDAVYRGEQFIDPALTDKMQGTQQAGKKDSLNRVTLTRREQQILQMVVNGATNQQIVDSLFLSLSTVKNYRNRIFMKLDVKNMAELTKKALIMGLVE